jgi:hypothetical protein
MVAVPGPVSGGGVVAPSQLLLKLDASDAHAWKVGVVDHQVRLVVGSKKLVELEMAVQAVQRHEGDFAIGPEGDEHCVEEQLVWFWWMPREPCPRNR